MQFASSSSSPRGSLVGEAPLDGSSNTLSYSGSALKFLLLAQDDELRKDQLQQRVLDATKCDIQEEGFHTQYLQGLHSGSQSKALVARHAMNSCLNSRKRKLAQQRPTDSPAVNLLSFVTQSTIRNSSPFKGVSLASASSSHRENGTTTQLSQNSSSIEKSFGLYSTHTSFAHAVARDGVGRYQQQLMQQQQQQQQQHHQQQQQQQLSKGQQLHASPQLTQRVRRISILIQQQQQQRMPLISQFSASNCSDNIIIGSWEKRSSSLNNTHGALSPSLPLFQQQNLKQQRRKRKRTVHGSEQLDVLETQCVAKDCGNEISLFQNQNIRKLMFSHLARRVEEVQLQQRDSENNNFQDNQIFALNQQQKGGSHQTPEIQCNNRTLNTNLTLQNGSKSQSPMKRTLMRMSTSGITEHQENERQWVLKQQQKKSEKSQLQTRASQCLLAGNNDDQEDESDFPSPLKATYALNASQNDIVELDDTSDRQTQTPPDNSANESAMATFDVVCQAYPKQRNYHRAIELAVHSSASPLKCQKHANCVKQQLSVSRRGERSNSRSPLKQSSFQLAIDNYAIRLF